MEMGEVGEVVGMVSGESGEVGEVAGMESGELGAAYWLVRSG